MTIPEDRSGSGSCTLTRHPAESPLEVFTETVHSPAETAVTLPDAFTEATEGSLEVQVYTVSEPDGSSTGDKVLLKPGRSEILAGRETDPGWPGRSFTVTVQEACLPFEVVTVTEVIPGATPVTFPLESTVATAVFPDFQV